jgi:hypothetical protein
MRKFIPFILFFFALSFGQRLLAVEPVTNSFEFSNLNRPIPDTLGANFGGVQDTREITMDFDSIVSVSVTLNITGTGSGAVNGDFYAYLTKGDDIAVLLNRPGRTSENLAGYGDNGLNVRFSDDAVNGDIHLYRLTLSGSHLVPLELGEQLTGSWAPDGRNVLPTLALDTHPRTHTLDVFEGENPNGQWTLFIADMDPGGTAMLASWGMQITAVPEPHTIAILTLGAVLIAFRRSKNQV